MQKLLIICISLMMSSVTFAGGGTPAELVPGQCQDGDNYDASIPLEKQIHIASSAIDGELSPNVRQYDKCIDVSTLSESVCVDGVVKQEIVLCQHGCAAAACSCPEGEENIYGVCTIIEEPTPVPEEPAPVKGNKGKGKGSKK